MWSLKLPSSGVCSLVRHLLIVATVIKLLVVVAVAADSEPKSGSQPLNLHTNGLTIPPVDIPGIQNPPAKIIARFINFRDKSNPLNDGARLMRVESFGLSGALSPEPTSWAAQEKRSLKYENAGRSARYRRSANSNNLEDNGRDRRQGPDEPEQMESKKRSLQQASTFPELDAIKEGSITSDLLARTSERSVVPASHVRSVQLEKLMAMIEPNEQAKHRQKRQVNLVGADSVFDRAQALIRAHNSRPLVHHMGGLDDDDGPESSGMLFVAGGSKPRARVSGEVSLGGVKSSVNANGGLAGASGELMGKMAQGVVDAVGGLNKNTGNQSNGQQSSDQLSGSLSGGAEMIGNMMDGTKKGVENLLGTEQPAISGSAQVEASSPAIEVKQDGASESNDSKSSATQLANLAGGGLEGLNGLAGKIGGDFNAAIKNLNLGGQVEATGSQAGTDGNSKPSDPFGGVLSSFGGVASGLGSDPLGQLVQSAGDLLKGGGKASGAGMAARQAAGGPLGAALSSLENSFGQMVDGANNAMSGALKSVEGGGSLTAQASSAATDGGVGQLVDGALGQTGSAIEGAVKGAVEQATGSGNLLGSVEVAASPIVNIAGGINGIAGEAGQLVGVGTLSPGGLVAGGTGGDSTQATVGTTGNVGIEPSSTASDLVKGAVGATEQVVGVASASLGNAGQATGDMVPGAVEKVAGGSGDELNESKNVASDIAKGVTGIAGQVAERASNSAGETGTTLGGVSQVVSGIVGADSDVVKADVAPQTLVDGANSMGADVIKGATDTAGGASNLTVDAGTTLEGASQVVSGIVGAASDAVKADSAPQTAGGDIIKGATDTVGGASNIAIEAGTTLGDASQEVGGGTLGDGTNAAKVTTGAEQVLEGENDSAGESGDTLSGITPESARLEGEGSADTLAGGDSKIGSDPNVDLVQKVEGSLDVVLNATEESSKDNTEAVEDSDMWSTTASQAGDAKDSTDSDSPSEPEEAEADSGQDEGKASETEAVTEEDTREEEKGAQSIHPGPGKFGYKAVRKPKLKKYKNYKHYSYYQQGSSKTYGSKVGGTQLQTVGSPYLRKSPLNVKLSGCDARCRQKYFRNSQYRWRFTQRHNNHNQYIKKCNPNFQKCY